MLLLMLSFSFAASLVIGFLGAAFDNKVISIKKSKKLPPIIEWVLLYPIVDFLIDYATKLIEEKLWLAFIRKVITTAFFLLILVFLVNLFITSELISFLLSLVFYVILIVFFIFAIFYLIRR